MSAHSFRDSLPPDAHSPSGNGSNTDPASAALSLAEHAALVRNRIFFIVGCGRSGTSLLQSMISSHPLVSIPPETGFYPLVWARHVGTLGELSTPSAFESAIQKTLSFWRIADLGLDPKEVRRAALTQHPSWESILVAILTVYARETNATLAGEKSPHHIRYLGALSTRFPRGKFIHVVRDPRAVALSFTATRANFGRRFVTDACRQWGQAIQAHRSHSATLTPDRYRIVRYEQLVREPQTTLRSLSRFLGIPFAPEMLEYHKRVTSGFHPSQGAHMINTLSPVFTSSIDKWKTLLSPRQIAIIEHILCDQMRFMDYPLTGASTRISRSAVVLDHLASIAERAVKRLAARTRRTS